jgi:hypothetical protein
MDNCRMDIKTLKRFGKDRTINIGVFLTQIIHFTGQLFACRRIQSLISRVRGPVEDKTVSA